MANLSLSLSSEQIETVLRRYIMAYVTCSSCKSGNTLLTKDNRITYISCDSCKSIKSVKAINSGFQAVSSLPLSSPAPERNFLTPESTRIANWKATSHACCGLGCQNVILGLSLKAKMERRKGEREGWRWILLFGLGSFTSAICSFFPRSKLTRSKPISFTELHPQPRPRRLLPDSTRLTTVHRVSNDIVERSSHTLPNSGDEAK